MSSKSLRDSATPILHRHCWMRRDFAERMERWSNAALLQYWSPITNH